MARAITHDAGFILHSHAWKESSYILRVLTQGHGRISIVGRGLRGSRKAAPVLTGQLYQIQWRPGVELGALSSMEITGPQAPSPVGENWWASQYLSELVLYGVAEGEAVPQLFAAYVESLNALRIPSAGSASVLRRFEWALLNEAGLGFDLQQDAEGRTIQSKRRYQLQTDVGLVASLQGGLLGDEWQALIHDNMTEGLARRLRRPLQQQLGLLIDWRKIKSREMWRSAQLLRQQHQHHAQSD